MLVLTDRQHSCLLLRSRGLSNKEVADALGCSEKTVECHFKFAMENNPGHSPWSLLAEFVRDQCSRGIWE